MEENELPYILRYYYLLLRTILQRVLGTLMTRSTETRRKTTPRAESFRLYSDRSRSLWKAFSNN